MSYYSDNAEVLFERYNSADPAALHADWLKHLPETPGLACDIGAGTGRDANWLAEQGWDVIAVEPEAAFREKAKLCCHPGVEWLDDRLPELTKLRELDQSFNLLLLSAVWMHLPLSQREPTFRILEELLLPEGLLVISLRHSSDKGEIKSRKFHSVSVAELKGFIRDSTLMLKAVTERPDGQGRDFVSWQTVLLEKAKK